MLPDFDNPLEVRSIPEIPGGYWDDHGFYNLPDGSFYDPDGYYFYPDGYDKYGGYYDDNNNYVPGKGNKHMFAVENYYEEGQFDQNYSDQYNYEYYDESYQ